MSGHATDTTVRRLERSRSDRMLGGVAGGLAAYFELHPAVFRVSFVVLTLMGGAGIPVYLAALLVVPDEGAEDSIAARTLRTRRPWLLVVAGLLTVVLLGLLSEVPLWEAGDAWAFMLVAGAAALVLAWLVVAGTRSRWLRALGVVIASAAVLLLVLAAAFLATFDVHVSDGVGERRIVPVSAGDLRSEYALGIGELTLDLRGVELPLGETWLDVRVDAGRITVLAPEGVALRATADAKLGEIRLLGRRVDGWEVREQVGETGLRVLVIDADVGIGEIRVERGRR
jgi:phage shock protein PspC (stress-responsive transcriptional regulator)